MVVGEFTTEIDVLVIGAGPGGYVAAIRASDIGGACLNVGCIPSKAMIHAADTFDHSKHTASMGITVKNVKVDFVKVQEWKNGIIKQLTGGVGSLFKGNKIQVIPGEALCRSLDRKHPIISEIGLAIEIGATLEDIELTIHAHPTLGEVIMEAAEQALGHPIHVLNK